MRPTIVYDAECRFCRAQISRIQKLSRERDIFEYLPIQTENLNQRYHSLLAFEGQDGMRFIDDQHLGFIGADAVSQIAQRLPYFHWVKWLYAIPGIPILSKFIYSIIAKNRYRLGKYCNDGTCKLD